MAPVTALGFVLYMGIVKPPSTSAKLSEPDMLAIADPTGDTTPDIFAGGSARYP
ncbi:hypothetical protein KY084_01575 [Stakelama sp. CBK3Z-3]|uniref:Uncharacterized protein n=1 Tax=Stakelama flava TaxID=2860338 RepID=A0ABS6XJC6_9SPHN|nr:hypothetical protein [Stakelama flava]MBW4329565.1 hypothetical protein [Stakelama flava]